MKKKISVKTSLRPSYHYLTIGFVALAIILITVILYFALSQATVIVSPLYQKQSVGFAVQVTDVTLAETAGSNRIFGQILETTLEESQTFQTPSSEIVSDKASGQVTIYNNYSRDQRLIATTRLLTADNKLYRLAESLTVPAGGQVTALAIADQSGTEFVSGSARLTIPGLWEPLQAQIYAETEGFSLQSRTEYRIDKVTLDNARLQLQKDLSDLALAKLREQLSEGQTLSEQTLKFETVKYSASAEEGASDQEFQLTMAVAVKGLVFDENQLKQMVTNDIPEIYQSNAGIMEVDPDSFIYEVSYLDNNSENLIGQIKGTYTLSLANIDTNTENLAGKTKKEAREYLLNNFDVQDVEIMLPFWTKHLPPLPDKINLQIKK